MKHLAFFLRKKMGFWNLKFLIFDSKFYHWGATPFFKKLLAFPNGVKWRITSEELRENDVAPSSFQIFIYDFVII